METLYQIASTFNFLVIVIILLFVFLGEPIVYALQFFFWLVREDSPRAKPALNHTRVWITAAVAISVSLAAFTIYGLASNFKQQQIEQTEAVANAVADRYFAQLQSDPNVDLQPGTLEETDVWDQSLRLTVQRSVFGHGVEVYSDGPDGKQDTHDDIFVSRFHPADSEEFGGNMVLSGKTAIQDWIVGKKDLLVPTKEGDEVKIEQEFKGTTFSIKFGSGKKDE